MTKKEQELRNKVNTCVADLKELECQRKDDIITNGAIDTGDIESWNDGISANVSALVKATNELRKYKEVEEFINTLSAHFFNNLHIIHRGMKGCTNYTETQFFRELDAIIDFTKNNNAYNLELMEYFYTNSLLDCDKDIKNKLCDTPIDTLELFSTGAKLVIELIKNRNN